MSGGQSRLHLVHLLGDLHAHDVDLLAPRELEEELGAVGGGRGVEVLDARQGGQDLLHRLGDLLLDLWRVGVGVRDLDEDERRVHRRQEGQGQAIEGDGAHQQHAHQDHGGGDRPANGEGRQVHRWLPFLTSRCPGEMRALSTATCTRRIGPPAGTRAIGGLDDPFTGEQRVDHRDDHQGQGGGHGQTADHGDRQRRSQLGALRPSPRAIGISPKMVVAEVIRIGRSRPARRR